MTGRTPPPTADPPPGAQAERTRLAWVRTTVAVIVSAVVGLRVTAQDVGTPAVVITAACALISGAVLLATRSRYRRAVAAIDSPADLPDGRLPALFGAVVAALGLLVVVYAVG